MPFIKNVDILSDEADPRITKIDITISLQSVKSFESQTMQPFGLFVALVNDGATLKMLKNNEMALRYEIANKTTPATESSMLKRYIGVEDFLSQGKIKHIINERDGTGVVVKDIVVGMDIIIKEEQNLWAYCIPYQMDNKDANVNIVGAANSHKFDIGTPTIESILINGLPPAHTYLYWLRHDVEGYGKRGDIWPGPVHRKGRRHMAGMWHTRKKHPRVRRTKISNQKIKDLRLLQTIEGLDVDNFVVTAQSINRKNFRNYRRVKRMLGRRYFSRLSYARNTSGKFNMVFSFDYDAFIDDNSKLSGLFLNKGSLKSCFKVEDVTVHRKRRNYVSEGSKLCPDAIPEDVALRRHSPRYVGSLRKGGVSTMNMEGNNKFVNFVIGDNTIRKEPLNRFVYDVNFEFTDNTAAILDRITRRLQKKFTAFESYISKFEGAGQKNYDIEEYLRVNARVIKSDNSWLSLINEFVASIWFIFGAEGFGDQSPILYKKNLTTMVNPMTATEKTFREFTELIQDYIGDLRRVISQATVGNSGKKFSARSKVSRRSNLVRKIKYKHRPRPVTKHLENETGFDYLGATKFLNETLGGLSSISYDNIERRFDFELNKYRVNNANVININKVGFLSPWSINTPYEIQETFQDHLELADGLVILDNKQNPSIAQFVSDGSLGETKIKISKMTSILGSAGVTIEPMHNDMQAFIEENKAPSEEENSASPTDYLSPNFMNDNQYLTTEVSGSEEFRVEHLQSQQLMVKVLESDLAERMVDGVGRNFMPPRIRRTRYIRGSLALAKINQNKEEFLDLNSFERDIFYNSLTKVQVLTGYRHDNIRRPIWRTLTRGMISESREAGTSLICRLKRCPSVTVPGNKYYLSRYNYIFILGSGFTAQNEILNTSYKRRYIYYLRRMRRLDKSRTTNINRGAAYYGAEYYVSDAMVFKLSRADHRARRRSKRLRWREKQLAPILERIAAGSPGTQSPTGGGGY